MLTSTAASEAGVCFIAIARSVKVTALDSIPTYRIDPEALASAAAEIGSNSRAAVAAIAATVINWTQVKVMGKPKRGDRLVTTMWMAQKTAQIAIKVSP